MKKQIIVWSKLPGRYALFTRRSTTMVNLDNSKIIQHYSANVKINMVEQTMFNGERYFRTASASERGLNWAIKASSFMLPANDAPLAPLTSPTLNSNLQPKVPRSTSGKQKSSQKPVPSNNGEKGQPGHTAKKPEKRAGLLKGLFKKFIRKG